MTAGFKTSDEWHTLRMDVPCMFACPALTNVPEYIHAVTRGDYEACHFLNQAKNLFPGSLGRVCTRPCEEACRHGYVGFGDPVNICRLKRTGADFRERSRPIRKARKTGKTVAVVGGGPAGLGAARDLLLLGHDVAVYEASDRLGGMLPLAIPEFRLPRKIIEKDIAPILDLGPQVFLNMALGRDMSIEELLRRNDAVLLAVGCQRPYRMGVPGETLSGVVFGLDFLMDVLAGKKVDVGRKALVIGGGYTAVDCARTLVRLGAEEVTMVYRRTAREISIGAEEMHHLKIEDVAVRYLTTVSRFLPGDDGKLKKVELVRTKLDGGKVALIADSAREEAFDSAVICVGQGALGKDFITKDVGAVFRDERLVVNPETFHSLMSGLFGAGDYVYGTRSIIDAIGDGRYAAWGIHAFLTGRELERTHVRIHPAEHSGRKRSDDFIPRVQERTTVGKKRPRMALEAALGLNREEGHTESLRCYLCNLHYEINIDDCIFCIRCIDEAPVDCIKQVKQLGEFGEEGPRPYTEAKAWNEIGIIYIDNDRCVRCGKCLDVCPTRCISVTKYTLEDPVFGGKA